MTRLLLVEDDSSLGLTLKERLEKEGYEVFWARSARQVREFINTKVFDLIIFDVGLPDGSGFDLAREIRQQKSLPFIFVTALSSPEDRLQGYEIGAEEYIPKPFHLKELLMRVRHVLDNHALQAKNLGFDVVIHFDSHTLSFGDGQSQALPTKDFQILELLIRRAPAVVSRDEILDKVWGEDQFPSARTVDNTISRLRQCLGAAGRRIRSVRGVGYQWQGEE